MLQSFTSYDNFVSSLIEAEHENHGESKGEIFNWLAILWERGFHHDNPQGDCEVLLSRKIYSKVYYKQFIVVCYRIISTLDVISPFLSPLLLCKMQLGASSWSHFWASSGRIMENL